MPIIRFGDFELDPDEAELRKGGIPLKLPPQPFQILALLASKPGQLVTREQIQQEVWGHNSFGLDQGMLLQLELLLVRLRRKGLAVPVDFGPAVPSGGSVCLSGCGLPAGDTFPGRPAGGFRQGAILRAQGSSGGPIVGSSHR